MSRAAFLFAAVALLALVGCEPLPEEYERASTTPRPTNTSAPVPTPTPASKGISGTATVTDAPAPTPTPAYSVVAFDLPQDLTRFVDELKRAAGYLTDVDVITHVKVEGVVTRVGERRLEDFGVLEYIELQYPSEAERGWGEWPALEVRCFFLIGAVPERLIRGDWVSLDGRLLNAEDFVGVWLAEMICSLNEHKEVVTPIN